tara:strand:+ start:106 stop:1164 length:1059 start_codon:yes stop_codon:yes gene_type:complete
MAYASITKPSLHFNTALYTGTDAAKSVTGVGFQPDWTWIKCRSHGGNAAFSHILTDAARGVNKTLFTNTTDAQSTNYSNGYLSAFGTDGFTVTAGDAVSGVGRTYVGWNWKANGQGSSNTSGSINSTYTSANTTAGFSIVTYTGNGSAGATIGHGLGAVPKMIIVKCLNDTQNWFVYHESIGATQLIRLNLNSAALSSSGSWNNTAPTSSVFSVGTESGTNQNGNLYVAYCFAEKKGYSRFSSYTGSANTDGPFVYTGFKPAWVMWKKTATEDWGISDNKRDTFNVLQNKLRPNSNSQESTSNSHMDFLSNGFKFRSASGEFNGSGGTYIFMAFAEEPLVANVGQSIPATAK